MAIIGIDLGTSNSLAAYWDGQEVGLIKSRFGNHLTPSVVGIDDNGELLVGEIAKERLVSHPQKTAATFKRFMGTEKIYQLGEQHFTPIELSSLIIASLKEDAELYLQQPCEEVVISVPAYFNNIQREATMEAANLAGLKVLNLISEPTAAAMAYGFHKEDDLSILVIDLGGGTFDVSLLEMFEGIMQVEAIAGDNHLGGEDFTQVIVRDCLAENQLENESLPAAVHSVLYQKAETLKKELANQGKTGFDFTYQDTSYHYQLDRQKYEELCEPLLARMRMPIGRVLNDKRMAVEDIDRVILIGGATKDSVVRSFLAKLLRKIPYTGINPDEAVGMGAGIQTALKKDQKMVSEMMLTDVCAHTLGVESVRQMGDEWIGGVFSPIIERNTTIPVSKIETFYTVRDQQPKIRFGVYQGESPRVEENLKIGEIVIPLEPAPKDYPVDCRFTYDTNGLLEVLVTIQKTGKTHQLIIEESPGKLTKAEIKESLRKLEKLKIHPRDSAENRLLMARLDRLYAETTGEMRGYVQNMLLQFEAVMQKQDPQLVKKTAKELNQKLNELEKGFWL
ncbi:molecular chaperone HscC [Enterococcus sp. 669A]|uniref:Chaperone protein DnaK n=1 Tax=Candidatus Enterococcus moelleringii TaxID=2815325 RepID=A0ABS3L6J5_9ENTE|nr:molecular chaperone HscC [Enterococcus sp. 669A]MBO1305237.1 molecular chaperone HscC [Enterococcus sp. 669A]